MSDAPAPAPTKRPWYRDPFVIAFAIGVVVLTILPLMQRGFLSAPPPIRTLPTWELPTLGGELTGSSHLKGVVWLATFAAAPCNAACVERQETFGRARSHLDDLQGRVQLLTFVLPGAGEAVRPLVTGGPAWQFPTGTHEQLAPVLSALRAAWGQWAGTDAGSTLDEFVTVPTVLLVDQNQAVRGFWRDDAAGRGNAINAARLLARHGAAP